MKELIQRLVALQQLDSRILEKRAFIGTVPARIGEVDEPLRLAKGELEKVRQKQEALLKKKKDRESAAGDIQEKIKKAKGRVSDIKTNKEFEAHKKEIESAEREIVLQEDQILQIMEELEGVSKEVSERETGVKAESAKIDAFKKELDAEVARLEKELTGIKEERAALAAAVEPDIYNSYMTILSAGAGLAVTAAKNEVCTGCNMNIPPQLFVEIRKGEELIQCPQCRRILYPVDEDPASNN